MKKEVFGNGLTVLYKHKPGNSVVVEVMIKVGSNCENNKERGMSHFIEHMLFEGTEKRPTNWLISNEIEKIGGEFNAYTSNERTCFYAKVQKKHFNIAVDVLADIIKNPSFKEEYIKKEKNIVSKEIDLVNDEPRYYQWDFLQRTLFSKHPAKYPISGEKKVIQKITRKEVLKYFNKYYVPSNIIISIVGDVKSWKKTISENFSLDKNGKVRKSKFVEPIAKFNVEKREKKKIVNTYSVLGFKTVNRGHKDSYVLDVINGVLGRGQSGRMFTEIRAKKGLAYEVGTQSISEPTYGYFAIYATIDKKNVSLVKKMILEELEKLKTLKQKDLHDSKTYIEGDYLLEIEDGQKVADQMLFWEQVKNAKLMDSYVREIKKVTLKDVSRVVNKYFKYHSFVVIEGK